MEKKRWSKPNLHSLNVSHTATGLIAATKEGFFVGPPSGPAGPVDSAGFCNPDLNPKFCPKL